MAKVWLLLVAICASHVAIAQGHEEAAAVLPAVVAAPVAAVTAPEAAAEAAAVAAQKSAVAEGLSPLAAAEAGEHVLEEGAARAAEEKAEEHKEEHALKVAEEAAVEGEHGHEEHGHEEHGHEGHEPHLNAKLGSSEAAAEGHAAHGGHAHAKHYASVMVLVGVAFIMALFYMVNSHQKGVPGETWSMISSSVSIFAAVMAYNGLNSIGAYIMFKKHKSGHHGGEVSKNHGGEHGPTAAENVELGSYLLILWFVLVETSIWVMKGSKLRLAAWGTIGGHVMGFAAIDLYTGINGLETFNTGAGMTVVVMLIYIVTCPLIAAPVALFYRTLAKKCSKVSKETLERVHEQAADTSLDFFCMGLSALISKFWHEVCIGVNLPHNHKPNAVHRATLFAVGVVMLLLAGFLSVVSHNLKGEGPAKTLMTIAKTTISLGAAWVFIDVASLYALNDIDNHVMAAVAVACVNSIVFVLAVYAFSAVLRRSTSENLKESCKAEFLAISLMVGLSWEHVFDHAVEGVGTFAGSPGGEKALTFASTFGLVAIVFPAWTVYMLPKHDAELKSEYNGVELSPMNAFCDCGGGGGGGDGEESEYETDDAEAALE